MGRVIAWLRDDPGGPYGCGQPPETPMGEPIVLPPEDPAAGGLINSVEIRQRTTVGWDADGVPQYDWVTVYDGPCLSYQQRSEFDDEAGFTIVKARLSVAYPHQVPESSIVITNGKHRWRVTAANLGAGGITLDMNRIDG